MNKQNWNAILAISGLLALSCPQVHAQSIFEIDGKGSAILVDSDRVFRANIADKAFSLTVTDAQDDGKKMIRKGLSVSGKANNGIASVFDKKGFAQDVTYSAFFGQSTKPITAPDQFYWTLKATYQTSRYKTIDKDETNFTTRTFHSPGATLYLLLEPEGGTQVIGASLGYMKSNNINDLENALFQTQTVLGVAGGVQTVLTSSTEVKKGTYKTFNSMPLVIDYLLFKEKSTQSLDFFVRQDLKGNGSLLTPGIAILFSEKGKPRSFHSGVAFTYNKKTKFEAKLVAGLNF